MIFVIGGPPGSGKTTVAERWAAARGSVLVSAGTRFRAMAKERGLSLEAFGRAAEGDPSIDRALDAAVQSEIRTHVAEGRDVVVDGRIQAYLLEKEKIPCLKVLIDAPLAVRAKRIAGREGTTVEEAKREILAREKSERIRYKSIYGIDVGDTGTLDPRVTGVLPVALADATRALEAVLEGDKEYVGVMQLHQDVDERRVRSMMGRFVGEIYQIPPIRSAVKREQRTRNVYELEPFEVDGRNVLFRVRCESGTYIRTLCDHIRVGDLVGVYTGKGEAVAIAKALMTSDRIVIAKSGAAADTARVLMSPGTYPRLWK